jgi:deazaflavin-dependent oxidoreductase (nitroreductase family)
MKTMNELNARVVAEFRANGGRVTEAMAGHFKDVHLLLLHNTGRRSGHQHVTPLLYLKDAGAYIVMGSNGGAEKEPTWVTNVAAMSEVIVEVGEQKLTTKPTLLRQGPERDRLQSAMADYWPDIRVYQILTTRTFPLIVLEPIPDSA